MSTTIKTIIISPDGSLQSALPLVKAVKDALDLGDDLIIEVQDIYSDSDKINCVNNGNIANFRDCDNNSVLQMHAGDK